MQHSLAPNSNLPMIPRRISVVQYEQMIRCGVFTENDRVELIRGFLVDKMPIGPLHSACLTRLNKALQEHLGGRAVIRTQDPVVLPDSEPEPDISLAEPRVDYYASGHPQATELFAVVEVSDSTLDFDRDEKLPMYADGAIPEYWIVNLIDRQIEVYRQPQRSGTYASRIIAIAGDEIELLAFPGVRFAVADILPQ